MFNGEFTICYDQQPDEVISAVADALLEFGLFIETVDEGDGFVKYQIIQCTKENILNENE